MNNLTMRMKSKSRPRRKARKRKLLSVSSTMRKKRWGLREDLQLNDIAQSLQSVINMLYLIIFVFFLLFSIFGGLLVIKFENR